ncbi:MAG: YidC/Oxa1 family insertase periplasmic-domain containing protein [Planctomycetes bacterium]|nr:YidC/Oxa1 family insertase periplasmic-domain containing protein [Planctomycetota bacterium]
MDERRFFAFVMLSVAVVFAWPHLFPPPPAPPPSPIVRPGGGETRDGEPRGGEPRGEAPRPAPAAPVGVRALPPGEGALAETTLCSAGLEVRVAAVGGAISHGTVLANEATFVRRDQALLPERGAAPGLGALELTSPAGALEYENLILSPWDVRGGGAAPVEARILLADGVEVVKRFEFGDDPYVFRWTTEFRNTAPESRRLRVRWWGPGSLHERRPEGAPGAAPTMPLYVMCGETSGGGLLRQAVDADDLDEGGAVLGGNALTVDWTGLSGQYFVAAWRPLPGDAPVRVEGRWGPALSMGEANEAQPDWTRAASVAEADLTLEPGATRTDLFEVFLGPKATHVLKEHGNLARFVHDGWLLGPIERLLLRILGALGRWTGSYGVAILLLTVVVRLGLLPLSIKQTKSMLQMQERHKKMQPKLEEVRRRFPKDAGPQQAKQRQQEELRLMREHGVVAGQLGGCLPILIQMPVFIALFRVLSTSIELRGAEFLWFADLTAPDALSMGGLTVNIMPILWIILMFVQMKLAPAAPAVDPAMAKQQKMTQYMMFGMFGFMLYSYPAGLHLYFTTSTLWGILEQKTIRARLAAKAVLAS